MIAPFSPQKFPLILLFLPLFLGGCMTTEVFAEKMLPKAAIKEEQNNELITIYNWLSNTNELHIHQLRGATENKVYLHQDGHFEVVFDKDGNRVEDGYNDGSYNYAHPVEDPLNHFLMDMLPWITLGNTREDPTTMEERLWAYTTDLCEGVIATRKAGLKEVDVERLDDDERRAAAIFLAAVELAEVEWIFQAMENENSPLEDMIVLREQLYAGMYEALMGKPLEMAEQND